MAALTMVMRELADFDPGEFINVRTFCSGCKVFQKVLKRPRATSPTNSDSSGISVGSSSNGDDESPLVKPKTDKTPKINHCTGMPKMFQFRPMKVIKESHKDKENTSDENHNISSNRDKIVTSKEEQKIISLREQIFTDNKDKIITSNDRIFHGGRDILNLERNTRPWECQLTSPLYGSVNSILPYKYRTRSRHPDDKSQNSEYLMSNCEDCDFKQPFDTYLSNKNY